MAGTVQDFHAFELAAWQAITAPYHEGFGPLTSQSAESLLDAAGVGAGTVVLDVATGPGYVASAAHRRGARVTAIDFSAPMVAQARRFHPGIDFREGDAESLAFADGTFDAVVMGFGLLHLARPEQAIREAFRVLKQGGRFAFTVWARPDEAVAFGMVLTAVERHGRTDVGLPPGPPFFRYSDQEAAFGALRDAGFVEPRLAPVPQFWRLASPDALVRIMSDGTARTGGLLRAQTPEAMAAIRADIATQAARYATTEGLVLPMPAVLVSGLRP